MNLMPTKDGDAVVQRLTSFYRVWPITKDGAQEPDPNIAPFMTTDGAAAISHAEKLTAVTDGRVFSIAQDGSWTIHSN